MGESNTMEVRPKGQSASVQQKIEGKRVILEHVIQTMMHSYLLIHKK